MLTRGLTRWHHSILWRTVLAVVGIATLVGILSTLITSSVTNSRAQGQVDVRLGEMLDTVENSVSIACFAGDAVLAGELARGLIRNQEVLAVTIRSDRSRLAKETRADADAQDMAQAAPRRLVRKVYSPFLPDQVVGEIELLPHLGHIQEQVKQETLFVGGQLAGQLLAVVLAVVVVVISFFIRPIKSMSDGMHAMDATAGDTLPLPKGLEGTEIGRLADDVNNLAARLVNVLNGERALRLQQEMDERKYHAIFDNAETGLFIVDQGGRLSQGNRAFLGLFGLPAEASMPERLMDLPWRDPAQVEALLADSRAAGVESDLELAEGKGPSRWIEIVLRPIGEGMAQGVANDVTTRKQAEATAHRLALTDPLTGMSNRQGLEQAVSALIHAHGNPEDADFCLMLANLDGFKKINDALGLTQGDQILKEAMSRLVKSLKKGDVVARIGGDEFALVLPSLADKDRVTHVAQRIVGSLGQAYDLATGPVHLGASVGIVIHPRDGADLPALWHHAELAMGRAKVAGGSRHQFFTASMVEAAESRRRLEVDLRQALLHGHFRLYYQPIVDLQANRLAGAEALIRWQHPDKGMIPPDAFIPLAEESGFIREIGIWTLETACQQLAAWAAEGQNLYLSLNVSARQIPDGLPPALLAAALGRHGVDPARLVLEITEGVLVGDLVAAQDWLEGVRALGIRSYLDDFGTGYSSLSYLKRFPFDSVKIDRSFVRDMEADNADRALVEAVIAMARGLGLKVVAEGVETVAQVELLRRLDCHYVQGYHFSRPVPAADFPAAQVRIREMLEAPQAA